MQAIFRSGHPRHWHVGGNSAQCLPNEDIKHIDRRSWRCGIDRVDGRIFYQRDLFLVDRPLVQPSVGPLGQHEVERSIGCLQIVTRTQL